MQIQLLHRFFHGCIHFDSSIDKETDHFVPIGFVKIANTGNFMFNAAGNFIIHAFPDEGDLEG